VIFFLLAEKIKSLGFDPKCFAGRVTLGYGVFLPF
jgi:hypothetical protein